LKRLVYSVLVVIIGIVVIAAGALLLVDADRFRGQLETALSESIGREVALGKLHVSIWSGSLNADDVHIGDDPAFGRKDFVTAESVRLGVRLWPLIARREAQVTSLTLEGPVVSLRQNAAGAWNFSSLGGADSAHGAGSEASPRAQTVSVDTLQVANGRIEVERGSGKKRSYEHVQLRAEGLRKGASFPFSARAEVAGGGSLEIDGDAGPWDAGNAVQTPINAQLQLHEVDLVAAGLMSGADDVGGAVDSRMQLRSQAGVLHVSGTIDVRRLKLMSAGSPASRPLHIEVTADYRLAARSGRIVDTGIVSGAARLAISGAFDIRNNALRLDLHAQGQQLPTDEVQDLLPAFGVILPEKSKLSGGSLGIDLDAKGQLDALVISGAVSLDNSLLKGFSLGSKLGVALSLAGIRTPRDTMIRHADARIAIRTDGVTMDPLEADIVDLGNILGRGRMAANGSLDFRMRVVLDDAVTAGGDRRGGGVLGNLLRGAPQEGIGVRVSGTAGNPRFKVDPGAILGLIGAGLSPSADRDSAGGADQGRQQKPQRTEDVLKDLLRGALKPKKDDSGSGEG
jgi:AsmA protein